MAQACDVPGAWDALEGTFEEVRERFMQDTTWIRFYVRPCCPPPLAGEDYYSIRSVVQFSSWIFSSSSRSSLERSSTCFWSFATGTVLLITISLRE